MKNNLEDLICFEYRKINYFKEQISTCDYPCQISFYQEFLANEVEILNMLLERLNRNNSRNIRRDFTLEELKTYDGSAGRPSYVAINGVVYDVSMTASWGGGTHFGFKSGQELGSDFLNCHKNSGDILKSLTIVGKIIK